MDIDLMITSFPKLLNATVTTLKLLSLSLFFILLTSFSYFIHNPKDAEIKQNLTYKQT